MKTKSIPDLERWAKEQDRIREIDAVLRELRRKLVRHPELRVCQLIVNTVNPSYPCPEIFYFTDKDLMEKLNE